MEDDRRQHNYNDNDEYDNDNDTRGISILNGTIVMDKSVKADIFVHHIDATIKCKSRRSELFEVSNLKEHAWIAPFRNKVYGTIQRISKRHAIKYMPESSPSPSASSSPSSSSPTNTIHSQSFEKEYAQSIHYENIKEAEHVLNLYKGKQYAHTYAKNVYALNDNGNGEENYFLWLCHYMKLPREVSSLIYQFGTCKPPPVFIFEENDLLLKFEWFEDDSEQFTTYLVARLSQ
mmetsp:Transcript_24863/g.30562  ORF Transcript_24863/g.30562 Transcript_24863/m.30562 type:complete len:233 (+) Transcript_24863:755-1453(+)